MYNNFPKLLISTLRNNDFNINLDSHKDILSKLKFISKIQEGEKINVKYLYVQQDGFMTKLSRTFYNLDNRGNTLNFVENTVKRSFEIIKLYINSDKLSERTICYNIIKDLEISKSGILNLMKTYIHDNMFISRMETLMDDIDINLLEIKSKVPENEFKKFISESDTLRGTESLLEIDSGSKLLKVSHETDKDNNKYNKSKI
jgi:hypothetical protein